MIDFKDLIIVHRGKYSGKFPDNSLLAFEETLKHNLPIELDVHILKDKSVVVFHDNNLKRMCNVNVNIKDLTYEEILKYKLLESENRIPTLKQVLELVNGRVLLDIELKYDVTNHNLEEEVIKILKDYKGEYILKSFDPRKVRYLKKLRNRFNMKYRVGLLINDVKTAFIYFLYSMPDFISFNYKNLNKRVFKFLSRIRPTLLYTIKTKEEKSSIKDFNGTLIIENYEEVLTK